MNDYDRERQRLMTGELPARESALLYLEHVRLLRLALETIEWVYDGEVDRCPSCGMRREVGHDWSCSTHSALVETKPKE